MTHTRRWQTAASAATRAGLLVAAVLCSGPAVSARQTAPPTTAKPAPAPSEFMRRVAEYVALHQKLERTLPDRARNKTPTDVDDHERSMAKLIAQARGGAKHGDVFTQETRAYFRRQIAAALSGPDSAQVRSSIMDENPGRIQLHINSRYPDEIPLSTMPPQLLAALPQLPAELEYRFIGRRLILLDVHAHIVVDYIDNALPG